MTTTERASNPFQRAVGHQHAVALIERGFPEIRHGNDILDSLDRAKNAHERKAGLSKRPARPFPAAPPRVC